MKYRKPALSYHDQLILLLSRNLTCTDADRAHEWLRRIGYYRLSAYFLPFREPGTDNFRPGVALEDILKLYKFDGGLRLLTMQAIDRIEVAVRAVITYHVSHELGVFGYADPANFAPEFDHRELMRTVEREADRSAEVFVEHYRNKYTSEKHLPIWMATELISFGTLSQMYANLRKRLRKQIAREFNQPATVFVSWLHALTAIRNTCAHHARLWNKELAVKPELPKAWKDHGLDNRRFYCIALIIQALLSEVSPDSRWKVRLKDHIQTYPGVDTAYMHFPADWLMQPLWREPVSAVSKDESGADAATTEQPLQQAAEIISLAAAAAAPEKASSGTNISPTTSPPYVRQ